MKSKNWTREELVLALNLYCKIPYGTFHNRNPQVIQLANLLHRSANSIALKLSNFASFDPYHQRRGIKGLTNTSKLDKMVWEEFTTNWANIGFESETILARHKKQKLEKSVPIRIDDLPKEGKEREAKVKVRVNQYFFRAVVLSSYDNKCCVTGLSNSALLIAGHILPWAKNLNERMNPSNGLCMNLLHDKAFEIGLIGITSEYRIKVSPAISSVENEEAIEKFFLPFESKEIFLPEKFLPDKKSLQEHFDTVFLQ